MQMDPELAQCFRSLFNFTFTYKNDTTYTVNVSLHNTEN